MAKKNKWILPVAVTGVVGGLAYYFFGRTANAATTPDGQVIPPDAPPPDAVPEPSAPSGPKKPANAPGFNPQYDAAGRLAIQGKVLDDFYAGFDPATSRVKTRDLSAMTQRVWNEVFPSTKKIPSGWKNASGWQPFVDVWKGIYAWFKNQTASHQ